MQPGGPHGIDWIWMMDESLRRRLTAIQEAEITEHFVYKAIARREKDAHNRQTLERIAEEERRHYEFWAERTGEKPAPRRLTVWKFRLLARLLGLTFAIKLMERGEEGAQDGYARIVGRIPEAQQVLKDETDHERELVAMIDEERLRYVGSVVLGLSDALVELTGALAGLTLALQRSRLIAAIGLITGVAAALSMAASEYLSSRAEESKDKSPMKSAVYTGGAYIVTVAILIAPFLLLGNPLVALALTIAGALLIILAFAYYVAVARELSFWRRFGEMAALSLGVAAVSFAIGYVVRAAFGVDL
jgi:VIT1/CCC1 family predicted Fe2+/Mn2+ transporter